MHDVAYMCIACKRIDGRGVCMYICTSMHTSVYYMYKYGRCRCKLVCTMAFVVVVVVLCSSRLV